MCCSAQRPATDARVHAQLGSIATSGHSLDRPASAKHLIGRAHGPTRLRHPHARPRHALHWLAHLFAPFSLVLTRLNIASEPLVTRHTSAPTRTHYNRSGGVG
jgi:hypothetical protein